MAFLRAEKKKSGTYLRIVQSYKDKGKPKHKTLHSLGKLEDYPPHQIENIAKKLLELSGFNMEDIVAGSFHEVSRVNFGYSLIIKKLWNLFKMNEFTLKIKQNNKTQFDWMQVLQLMIAERINEPSSKRQSYFNQDEYIGFGETAELQHFYRTLDIISEKQEALKQHLFHQQRSLFTQELDVVFYDVTTIYFDSQKETPGSKKKKGYSKDGKAHKTQIVLGLLVDKLRNPVTYHIYEGNTYEGHTMIDALKDLKKEFNIDRVIVVADSAMIDKDNRNYITDNHLDYILGDRIKSLPEDIKAQLLNFNNHKAINNQTKKSDFSYTSLEYNGRKIICTYSSKRAKKDAYEREKLIKKAEAWLANPSKYKTVKKRGAGRFIATSEEGKPLELDKEKIAQDAKYDGFKAIATSTELPVEEILSKYNDLYEVEHAFRALKSQLEIRPIYHWTDRRIEGHIAMCFLAYTFINYLRNITGLQYKSISKALDRMQMSIIKEDKSDELVYMRSNINEDEQIIFNKLKIVPPRDTTPQRIINQYFD
ncbi:MAG: IS1634 family transposase [Bacteroidota bacterium]